MCFVHNFFYEKIHTHVIFSCYESLFSHWGLNFDGHIWRRRRVCEIQIEGSVTNQLFFERRLWMEMCCVDVGLKQYRIAI